MKFKMGQDISHSHLIKAKQDWLDHLKGRKGNLGMGIKGIMNKPCIPMEFQMKVEDMRSFFIRSREGGRIPDTRLILKIYTRTSPPTYAVYFEQLTGPDKVVREVSNLEVQDQQFQQSPWIRYLQ